MTVDVVIVGVGGQGRECLEIAQAMAADGAPLNVVGFVDDGPDDGNLHLLQRAGYPYLGSVDQLLTRRRAWAFCIGIGAGSVRRNIYEMLTRAGMESVTLVHPSASVGSSVSLGEGTVIWPGARLTANVRVGRHVHINHNVAVGHDAVLEDYVTLNPLAAVSGNVRVSARSTVGAGAVVLQGLLIGEGSVVGGSACVVRDVPAGAVVKGVPAR